jgi:hypothetical protein
LSSHAAMFVKFHGVICQDRLPFYACVAKHSIDWSSWSSSVHYRISGH